MSKITDNLNEDIEKEVGIEDEVINTNEPEEQTEVEQIAENDTDKGTEDSLLDNEEESINNKEIEDSPVINESTVADVTETTESHKSKKKRKKKDKSVVDKQPEIEGDYREEVKNGFKVEEVEKFIGLSDTYNDSEETIKTEEETTKEEAKTEKVKKEKVKKEKEPKEVKEKVNKKAKVPKEEKEGLSKKEVLKKSLDKLVAFTAEHARVVIPIVCAIILISITCVILTIMNKTGRGGSVPLTQVEKVTSSSEKSEALEKIDTMLTKIRKGNGYFNVVDSEDTSETYIFNSNGEAIAQGSKYNYLTVFRNDGVSARYTDNIAIGPDIELLTLMSNSVSLTKSGTAELSKPIRALDTDNGFDVYYVYLDGWDNIKKLYSSVDEALAKQMIESMKGSVPDGKDIQLRFKYILGNEEEFSAGCELIMDDKEYTLWYFDGYLLLYDWKLSNDWYTYDFKDGETADAMLTDLLSELDAMFKQYADDNGLETPSKEESNADGGNYETTIVEEEDTSNVTIESTETKSSWFKGGQN